MLNLHIIPAYTSLTVLSHESPFSVSPGTDMDLTKPDKRRYTEEQNIFIRFARDDLCLSWKLANTLYNAQFHPDGEGARRMSGIRARYYRLLSDAGIDIIGTTGHPNPAIGILETTERRYWWMGGGGKEAQWEEAEADEEDSGEDEDEQGDGDELGDEVKIDDKKLSEKETEDEREEGEISDESTTEMSDGI